MSTALRTFFKSRRFITKRNVFIGALLIAGLLLFVSIYDSISENDGLAAFDEPVRAWAATIQNQKLTILMRIITEISAPLSVAIITVVGAVIWKVRKKETWRPALVAGGVATALILSAVIKTITQRERPSITDLVDATGAISYSFPSGHTLGAAALLLIIGYFIFMTGPTAKRFAVISLAILVDISLVAISRIYLNYHWLTDVTASVGLAFIVLAIIVAIDTYLKPIAKNKRTIS